MKDMKYIIADNVKLYRKKENITQMQLAERADLSLDSIKRIEGGKRTMSLENFLRISDALCVPLSCLLNDSNEVIPETEQINYILKGRDSRQKKYLLYMLREMARKMDELF